ncbi:MAG: glycosyltransferase family 25 protein [Actinomycetes bacterium]
MKAPKKYVVHVESQKDRKTEFEANNKHVSEIHWTYGLKGVELNLPRLLLDGLITPELFNKVSEENPRKPFAPNVIANAMSHIELWELAASSGDPVTVMENDAVLSTQFESESVRLIEANPQFDIIQWGWNFDGFLDVYLLDKTLGPTRIVTNQYSIQGKTDIFKSFESDRNLIQLSSTWGTHCYTISPGGAEKLLALTLPLSNTAVHRSDLFQFYYPTTIDGVMNRFYPHLNAYVCVPPLSLVENNKTGSTLQGQSK